ncbi:TetR/AcrR family transcriptional regulator [Enterovirga sp. CN4-39]|uniref:TetR/AcrR family transcriptional regulator n=1 Tax=Enterovirga sp. CN4-39 TaxID=3400910 RepID=UPI003C020DD0
MKRRVDDRKLIERRLPTILAAAAEAFASRGYHLTTMQDVAKCAEVSVGMIYQYVEDKQDLLYLVIEEVVSAYEVEIERNECLAAEPLERFVALLSGLSTVVVAHKAAARLGYREASQLRRDRLEQIKARERSLAELVARRVAACVESGDFPPVDETMLAYLCLISIQSWPVSAWRLDRQITPDEYLARGLRVLLGGLVPWERLAPLIEGSPAAQARGEAKQRKSA